MCKTRRLQPLHVAHFRVVWNVYIDSSTVFEFIFFESISFLNIIILLLYILNMCDGYLRRAPFAIRRQPTTKHCDDKLLYMHTRHTYVTSVTENTQSFSNIIYYFIFNGIRNTKEIIFSTNTTKNNSYRYWAGKLTFQLWSVCLIAVIQSQCIWKVKGYVMLTVVDVWLTSARLILLDAIAWVMWHTERTSHGECSKEKEKKERRKKLNTDNLTDQID